MTATTLHDLLTNPPGKFSRQIGARYMLRDALTAKFRETLADPARRRRYAVAVSQDSDDAYLVWVKVPSEKYAVDYDVVLRLQFDDGVRSILGAAVQLYCNSPGWVMPVGYVAVKTGLLVPGWEKALGRAAKEPPGVLNAHLDYGFDKTTYRAFLFVTGPAGLVSRADLERAVGGEVPDPDDRSLWAEAKLFEYQRAQEKHRADATAEKRRDARAREKQAAETRQVNQRDATRTSKPAGAVRAAKAVGARPAAGRKKTR